MMVDKAKIVTKGKTLAKNFNNHFINIVGKCGRTKPIVLVVNYNNLGNIARNVWKHENYPGIMEFKEKMCLNKRNTPIDFFVR